MYTLRPAAPADDEFLYQVYASTRYDELAVTGWDPPRVEAFLRQQFGAQHAWYREQYAGASFDVVVVGGAAAGRLYVARWPAEIRIVDIALLPPYRGHGVGSALLADLLAEADSAGVRVSAHVEVFNPARRLYARLGFVPVAENGPYVLVERPAAPARLAGSP